MLIAPQRCSTIGGRLTDQTRAMRISLDNSNPYDEQPLYFGRDSRYSTITSVRFVTPRRIACANYIQRKMYLVDFDPADGSHEVVQTIDTVFRGRTTNSELMDFDADNGEIVVSNFNLPSFSTYQVGTDSIRHTADFATPGPGPAHGVAYYPADTSIVVIGTSHSRNRKAGTYFVDRRAPERPILQIREPGWLSKDMCFLGVNAEFMVNIFCAHAPAAQEQAVYHARIVCYEIDLLNSLALKCDEILLPGHHVDSCTTDGERVWITTQGTDGGKVLEYQFQADQKSLLPAGHEMTGLSFPHGIDVNHGLLAVTEYGRCCVSIRPV